MTEDERTTRALARAGAETDAPESLAMASIMIVNNIRLRHGSGGRSEESEDTTHGESENRILEWMPAWMPAIQTGRRRLARPLLGPQRNSRSRTAPVFPEAVFRGSVITR